MTIQTIDIPINVNIGISDETADICARLLNLYLENHPGTFIEVKRSNSTDQIVITEQINPFESEEDDDE